ncbi:MAG: hypothetical protein COW88_03105 [Candidatus Lloydbacteria bacterium CG22_combo_CG10-13_8_21_14_all_47_15]|uniref:HTH HARE-type domain-containing protein n=1 Tax=Candidatus Lloydbacteria bacterium CG22_combo_CG10-13_8_21_14_all_47_15 TaxID=1974635 RepID=A0A2H0CTP5_9BACT|nr:MAG: hypothetical protein COW88_03105 [Candidatus Lloydbacteria bacterium CG22_combo_CG10-13_8_21_14_all_47_15]
MTSIIKFKPVAKRLLAVLPDRVRNVVVLRFGLEDGSRQTLESIGKRYGVTRERIRQIEDFGLKSIRKSDAYTNESDTFLALEQSMREYGGGIVPEKEFLSSLHKDDDMYNHIYFLLMLGEPFTKERENDQFTHRWVVDADIAGSVHLALQSLAKSFGSNDLMTEDELVERFVAELGKHSVPVSYREPVYARRWLDLSKEVGMNPLGEWGSTFSPNVNARGIRDFAYLVIRRHGSPMHFTEVAGAIEKSFNKKAHVATCHNELIKDTRFVLVGRGLYALKEWGYAEGIVRDVICDILEKHGPLSRDAIVEYVMKERYVKPNTILVNLQNGTHFRKNSDGTYQVK